MTKREATKYPGALILHSTFVQQNDREGQALVRYIPEFPSGNWVKQLGAGPERLPHFAAVYDYLLNGLELLTAYRGEPGVVLYLSEYKE